MSGGFFNGDEYKLVSIANEIDNYEKELTDGNFEPLDPELYNFFSETWFELLILYKKVKTIDLYIMGDNGVDSTKKHIKELRDEIKEAYKKIK